MSSGSAFLRCLVIACLTLQAAACDHGRTKNAEPAASPPPAPVQTPAPVQPQALEVEETPAQLAGPKVDGIVLATGQGQPESIAVDADAVYWSNYEDGRIMKVSKHGGEPQLLVQAKPLSRKDIALDEHALYWAEEQPGGEGLILSISKQGGQVSTLVSGQRSAHRVIAHDGYVYFSATDGAAESIRRAAVSGRHAGQVEVLAKESEHIGALVLEHGALYWTFMGDYSARAGGVRKLSLEGARKPVTLARRQWAPPGLAVDDAHVYWSTTGTEANIVRVAKAGGRTKSIATKRTSPGALAIDHASIYFTELGAFAGRGAVQRIDKRGPTAAIGAQRVADNQVSPDGLAIDATHIYWADFGGRTIRKLAKL